ncbi:hypothetical protein HG530_003346 [Fusarium avenaceum]|nr:hypothetical protein HG530_003346 [Fusarium avenaceum]
MFPFSNHGSSFEAVPDLRSVFVVESRELLVELLVLLVDVCYQTVDGCLVWLILCKCGGISSRVERAILVNRDKLAVFGLDNVQPARCRCLLDKSLLVFLVLIQVHIDVFELSFVYLVRFLCVIGEGIVVATGRLLLDSFIPLLALVNSPVPCALSLEIPSRLLYICFE